MGAYVTRTVNGKQVRYYKDDDGRLHRNYDDALRYQQATPTVGKTNSGSSRQTAQSARPATPSQNKPYTKGWITVPGKGKRWRTADGQYFEKQPGVIDNILSGFQQSLTAAGSIGRLENPSSTSGRSAESNKNKTYTEGWITVPGKGRRWRTADGQYFERQPGVIDNILSGIQQSLGAVGSIGRLENSSSTSGRSVRSSSPSVPSSRGLPSNYAAQESLAFANAQGWQDFVAGITKADPNALTRKNGQEAFKDGQRLQWDKPTLSWIPGDDVRRQGKNGEEYYDAYTKQWKPLPNYQSTPRPAPRTTLDTVLQTAGETINQLINPLSSFTRTTIQHGLPNAIEEALDRGLIDVPTLTREGFANAVSVKALLGELGRPFRLPPPPDARKAFSDNFNAMAIISPSGKTASYSRANPNWDPKLNFAKGPGGEDLNHKVIGQYIGSLLPSDNGGQTLTIRDFWDTNWTSDQHRKALNGRQPNFKERAVLLTSQIQEQGGLNRLPMGSTTQWDIAPRVPVTASQKNNMPSLPNINLPNLINALGLFKPQPNSASAPIVIQPPQNPIQIIQDQINLRPNISKGSIYVVQEGDTLWDIAQKTGKTIEAVAATNNITDPNLIMPGQRISF
jgi:hypothetical protein